MALCGACTVYVDGAATRSCITPVDSVGKSAITTIEAVGSTVGPRADDFGTPALAQVQRSGEPSEVSQPNLTGDWGDCGLISSAMASLRNKNPTPAKAPATPKKPL
jgi:isoquinoline 1-oxidoreductase alpha subunit